MRLANSFEAWGDRLASTFLDSMVQTADGPSPGSCWLYFFGRETLAMHLFGDQFHAGIAERIDPRLHVAARSTRAIQVLP